MKMRMLALAALLATVAVASAEFRTLVRAYEIALSHFDPPLTSSGSVTFRECEDCTPKRVRVTASTRYEINGQPVDLQELRDNVRQVEDGSGHHLIVMYDIESDTVTRVSVSL